MRAMGKTIGLSALLAFALAGPAAEAEVVGEGGGGVVWSLSCDGLVVGVPKGWALDSTLAASQGVDMFLYPVTARAAGAPLDTAVVAYVMPTVKQQDGHTVEVSDLVRDATDAARAQDPGVVVKSAPVETGENGLRTTTVLFDMPAVPRFEEVTYVENDDVIFAIILTARAERLRTTHQGFTRAMAAGARIVAADVSAPPCPTFPFPAAQE